MNFARISTLVYFTCLLGQTIAFAGEADWPQWRGPNRDGYAAEQSLLQQWPAGGPKLKWKFHEAGIGYSAFSIVDDRLYTMGTKGDQCFAICVDAKTGARIWETVISRAAADNDYAHGWGGGPRSTPTVSDGHAYVLTDVGVVACLQISDGTVVWSADFVNQYGGSIPKWGYSESVLVDGDRVVCTPGGPEFMIGLNKMTGEKVWSAVEFEETAQYVSPIKAKLGDVSFYVSACKSGVIGISADSGKILFKDSSTGNDVAVIPTPIVAGDRLYHTSDYGAGNTLLQLTALDGDNVSAGSVYHLSTKSMQNHHGGVVLVDGVIYGFTRAGRGAWMAQDFDSGETLWTKNGDANKSGSIAYADGRLYCFNDDDATLVLVEPSLDQWNAKGELKLPEQTEIPRGNGAIWAHPVIAGQTLYLRDQDLIFAYDIAR